ncbi:hypothetical protein NXH76_21705 [Blautia schinkii]|nr:hypothetical protein [Blautia schinkii]
MRDEESAMLEAVKVLWDWFYRCYGGRTALCLYFCLYRPRAITTYKVARFANLNPDP